MCRKDLNGEEVKDPDTEDEFRDLDSYHSNSDSDDFNVENGE